MRQTAFNFLGPVEIKVKVDDEAMAVSDKEEQRLTLPNGVHRVLVSFRRGYFFNESLLYTSQQEVTREALLDLTQAGQPSHRHQDQPIVPAGRDRSRRAASAWIAAVR